MQNQNDITLGQNFKNGILPSGNKDVGKQTHTLLVCAIMQTFWIEI